MARARDSQSGALFSMNGQVSIGATWAEDVKFIEDGLPMDLTGLDVRLQLRCCRTNQIKLSLTTSDRLSIVTDSDSGVAQILRIAVPPSAMTALSGDYFADLASKDASDVIQHWGHGIISFIDDPVLW